MKQVGSLLWEHFNVFQIFGANTGVGKTVLSTILAKRFAARKGGALYLKPVSTGSRQDSDSNHVAKFVQNLRHKTLFSWDVPVSPHVAARYGSVRKDDQTILQSLHDELVREGRRGGTHALVETAGGVLSPAPSGTLQADLYRPLRLPVLLVGDHRLGGIGSTISAWESLKVRGYDVHGLLMFKDEVYENSDYLLDHFARKGEQFPCLVVDQPPQQSSDDALDSFNMRRYYQRIAGQRSVVKFEQSLIQNLDERRSKLSNLAQRAHNSIWHPFLQHTERTPQNILAIDSAYGDYFQAYKGPESGPSSSHDPVLQPAFDGSASWWTQGLGHGNPELALAAAYASGRYGHVMFANAAHEPAVALAEKMLDRRPSEAGHAQARLTRAFYSDNGSTGMEVAVKMALKAASKRYAWKPQDNIEIIGLKGSYHGDTIGAMDCSEGNIYNEKVEWYSGRGHWLDFPRISLKDGRWASAPPPGTEDIYGSVAHFKTLHDVFDLNARKDDIDRYVSILDKIFGHLVARGHKLGALIMEPVILGAGGMLLVDPAFQHALGLAARKVNQTGSEVPVESTAEKSDGSNANQSANDWTGMPVVADEVFTGVYRLGQAKSSALIAVEPDISVHAKLLTGGLLPLALTLASESIYSAFLSDDKSDALLHGHSYTAHAVGCEVALHALSQYTLMNREEAGVGSGASATPWAPYKKDWQAHAKPEDRSIEGGMPIHHVWSMWSQDFVQKLSHRDDIEGLWALGSVMAIELKDPKGAGYASTASIGIRDKLLKGVPHTNQAVHCRVLGNVLYFMASLTTKPETIAAVQQQIEEAMG
ncbi:Ornithine aminotransferase car2 [Sphaceloma murrayae]|uniref:Ornithine aminotransferase car2 n=1 Tax=Sphaceloma murrayae TaxID=2082308 RepID=A0A2K1R247_9PEZI|nr:Ornithine aminotransferase car2 [Sphaceloma murrayae]